MNAITTKKLDSAMREFSIVFLLGAAAVGGCMAGTCLAFKKTLRNGRARWAQFLGYAFIGLTFGVLGVALSRFLPFIKIANLEGALLAGLFFGGAGVLIMLAANLGSTITLRYLGLRVTIEPQDPSHDRRREDGSKRQET